jgi:hypothetical protein
MARGSLRRADIRDRARIAACREHSLHLGGELRDRRGDDGKLGGCQGSFQRRRGLVHRSTARGNGESLPIRVEAGDVPGPGPLRGEPYRGADQPGADDRYAHGGPASADSLAEQLDDRAHLGGEAGEVGCRDLLRPVAQRLLGPRVGLDDDPVRAHRRRRSRER